MPPAQANNNKGMFGGLGFFGMVGVVMAGLKLKEHWDARYNPVSTEDGVAEDSAPPYRDTEDPEAVSLLNTELPMRRSTRRTPKKGCCVCCGMDCGLFWKAFGIVCGLMVLWGIFKGIMWAVTPSPTGLEGMPDFSTSLSCQTGQFIYNGTNDLLYNVPVNPEEPYHRLTTKGSGAGTIYLTQAELGQNDIQYKMTISSGREDLLQGIHFDNRDNEKLTLYTGHTYADACIRFDITLSIPRSVKKLAMDLHTSTQVKYDPNAKLSLESLAIASKHEADQKSMILTSPNIMAQRTTFEIWRGWLVGDITLGNSAEISTQSGDAVANLHIHPTAPTTDLPEAAVLNTVSGAGRMDIFYESSKGYRHRPIESIHKASRKGEVYLNYKDAEFSGLIEVKSPSMWATGMQALAPKIDKWTHFVGNKEGADRLSATSNQATFNLKF